uniref:basic salivary proline-rich protein 4-like n=1 Tax=Callithrix jacchus TaxID=9483 RepID=UPI0023DD2912|nr:basic salivary proline-rich protein 4-like [Callithrix jacchus]
MGKIRSYPLEAKINRISAGSQWAKESQTAPLPDKRTPAPGQQPAGPTPAGVPGLPHPLAGGETRLLPPPRSPPPRQGSPGLTHTPRAGASRHTREGRAPPRSPNTPRRGDHQPPPARGPERTRPGPLPGPAPATREIRSTELAHPGGRASAPRLHTRGGAATVPLTWLGGSSSLALGRRSRAGASEEARAAGRLEMGEGEEGEGVRIPGATSFLRRPPLQQPARASSHTRPVPHSLAARQPLPHPTPTHSHSQTLTPGRSSFPHSPVARARPRSHTARATPAGTAPLPQTERRLPARRGPARAPAPPSWRGGAAGGGGGRLEELGARPACRAPPSGSDTCVGTRPRSASPAPEPSLALEETRWIPRGERKGSARALRGRAFPPAPKPSTLRKRNGWGCEAGLGGSSL